MFEAWEKCRDVAAGSSAVKAAGAKYLPAIGDHKNKPDKYNAYKIRALFFNAMSRTIDGLAGAILQKAPVITFPEQLEWILEDLTLTTVPFEALAHEAVSEVLEVGRLGILVDMAKEEAPKQRPYAVLYAAEDIVSWKTERHGGDEVLTRVILCEGVEVEDTEDRFVTKKAKQYRVCELTDESYTQTIWMKKDAGSEEYIAGEVTTILRRGKPLDFIPFVFISPTGVSPEVVRPPLEDLADVNLSHYRGYADLKHGLHYTALPTPVVIGNRADKEAGALAIGSGVAWQIELHGDAKMLEFSGAGLKAIREDLQDMQRMMATLGARLLEEQPRQAETATAVSMRHAGEHATLRTIAQAVEQGLMFVLQWMAWWMGTEATPADTEAQVELNKDYFAARLTAQDLNALVMSLQAEAISYETFYAAIVRGDLARPGVTAEQEKKAIEVGGVSFTQEVGGNDHS
jgi:hypothetical protein